LDRKASNILIDLTFYTSYSDDAANNVFVFLSPNFPNYKWEAKFPLSSLNEDISVTANRIALSKSEKREIKEWEES